jgi:hypothetical protein
MIKKEIYSKTKRIPNNGILFRYTEKLDGANLVFAKKNGKLHICQRKNIFTLDEMDEMKGKFYRGLEGWLNEHGKELEEELHEGSAICGEWLGMGAIKYSEPEFDRRWYMFAKANMDDDYNLYNIMYDHDLFIYPFNNTEIPSYLGIVPVIHESVQYRPSKVSLDLLYAYYCNLVNRPVEGIVINYDNTVLKYVRYKNGKMCDYDENEHKNQ